MRERRAACVYAPILHIEQQSILNNCLTYIHIKYKPRTDTCRTFDVKSKALINIVTFFFQVIYFYLITMEIKCHKGIEHCKFQSIFAAIQFNGINLV